MNKIAEYLCHEKDFIWLDSAANGHFSIIACHPRQTVSFDTTSSLTDVENFLNSCFSADSHYSTEALHQENIMFTGGWLGYFCYESLIFCKSVPENLRQQIKEQAKNLSYPLACFHQYLTFFYQDHTTQKTYLITHEESDLADTLLEKINQPLQKRQSTQTKTQTIEHLLTAEEYAQSFEKIMSALHAGNYYEMNFTQEFKQQFHGDAFATYKKLREKVTTPFMAYYASSAVQILSASPECFFKIHKNQISTFPIKGTIGRGQDSQSERAHKNHLTHSAKERAELLMITDMLRNDLGKICQIGSVHVDEFAELHTFSHYHHLITKISGELKNNTPLYTIFDALFPGGSITGAPKIKVIEEIFKLEKRNRGVYTGALGVIGHNGFVEFNIPIRTLTLVDDHFYFATGGGIVIDSTCKQEYEECLVKAAGLKDVLLDQTKS